MFDQAKNRFLRSKRGVAVLRSIHLGSVLLAFLLCACNPDPFPGSPEDLARYGVVPGRTTDIEVRGIRFHIPAEFSLYLSTDGWIKKGHADALTFSLDISKAVNRTGGVQPGDAISIITRETDVMVEVHRDNPEETKLTIPDEYLSPGFEDRFGLRFASSNLTWVSIEERTQKGYPIHISCRGVPTNGVCWSTFDYGKNLQISYRFSESVLPYWKLIYESVLHTVQQFSAVDGSK